MKKVLLAFQFLTIIPLKDTGKVPEEEIGSASTFFPLIGITQGAFFVLSGTIFLRFFPPELANGLLVMVIVIASGALHLDGLADTFDAIASRGDKEKKLTIMKDSTIGSAGVAAIMLALLLKFFALNSLFRSSSVTFFFWIFLMPVFARWVMVPAAFHSKSARQGGIGRMFIENTRVKELITATLLTLLSLFLIFVVIDKTLGMDSNFSGFIFQSLFILIMLYILSLIATWFSNRMFGGMTGDTLGAISEISEILFLMVVIWLQRFI